MIYFTQASKLFTCLKQIIFDSIKNSIPLNKYLIYLKQTKNDLVNSVKNIFFSLTKIKIIFIFDIKGFSGCKKKNNLRLELP